ncbi:MAG: hypothetical protein M3R48_07870 [Candidatus Dormibacteraeota bacterium]|nr:hypothetical protein [Candidatus Dormibacteraeota bacterium]
MSDSPPPETDLDALAASLNADARDTTVFFRVLCGKLLAAFPSVTVVEREHSVLKSRRLPRKVTVQLGDETFEAEQGPAGVTCRHIHAVHGVGEGLPWSKQVSVDEWLHSLVTIVAQDAQATAAAASALRSLVT